MNTLGTGTTLTIQGVTVSNDLLVGDTGSEPATLNITDTVVAGGTIDLYSNGDINIMAWEGDGSRNSGSWKFILGTGKWEGLEGSGTWSVGERAKPMEEGTFQNCLKIKGTYELPK